MYCYISLLLSGLLWLLFGLFYKKNKQIASQHNQNIVQLQQHILLHKSQIFIREKGLQNYNFQHYNLNESLQVQSEVKLK